QNVLLKIRFRPGIAGGVPLLGVVVSELNQKHIPRPNLSLNGLQSSLRDKGLGAPSILGKAVHLYPFSQIEKKGLRHSRLRVRIDFVEFYGAVASIQNFRHGCSLLMSSKQACLLNVFYINTAEDSPAF